MTVPTCRRFFLLLCALAGSRGVALGQSSEQRQALGVFRDSLATVDDAAALADLEKALIVEARRDRDSAMVHLRLGLIALRLGDLGERKHYNDAASEFQWATTLQPTWPYGWFGLGLAELGVGDSEVSMVAGLQSMLGKDALTRSANAFARSAEVDPSFVVGLVELSNTALKQLVNTRMDVALAALRRASRTPAARHPDVLLARARVEREGGSADSALVAADALVAMLPNDAAALLEQAQARFLLGRSDGAGVWYRGLGLADGPTLALFRRDLALIMADSTLGEFDAATPAQRVTLVHAFFDVRDRDDLHRAGQRLREHYDRIDYARRNFRLVSRNRQYDIQERYRSTQEEYDDRGIIYVRHGSPDRRLQHNVPGIEANESWLYRRDAGDLIFHFVARQDVQDYRLVESLFDILGFNATMQARDSGDVNAFIETEALVRSRESLSPLYAKMLVSGRGGGAMLQIEERAAGKKAIAEGTSTDSWPLRFRRQLEATVFVAAAGADSLGPNLQLAFAVPGSALAPDASADGLVHEFRLRATVLDDKNATVATLDTIRRFQTATPVPPAEMMLALSTIRVPAGTLTIRASLEHGRAGLVSRRDTVHVSSPLSPSLTLSDLVIGARSVRLFWISPQGDTTWINPLARFRRAEAMEVTFELSGVPAGTPYHTELKILRPSGGSLFSKLFRSSAALSVGFDGVHGGGLASIRRELSLDAVGPGEYLVEVTVSTADGRKETRTQAVTVVK